MFNIFVFGKLSATVKIIQDILGLKIDMKEFVLLTILKFISDFCV